MLKPATDVLVVNVTPLEKDAKCVDGILMMTTPEPPLPPAK
jgi:hypothetical protein